MFNLTDTFRVFFPSSFRAFGLMTALMFLICVAAAQSASAATYTVTTTADSGAGSLRAAIASANATVESDTIDFNVCPSGFCTISLTSGQLAVNDAATSGTLTITNSTGANNLQIAVGNFTLSRVFVVNTGGNLTLNGLTVSKGDIAEVNGGGILNSGTLTITNSIVSGNSLLVGRFGEGGKGGGIYNDSGTLTITNSTISGNTTRGRASGADGGGIYNNTGTVLITNSIVSGNSSEDNGGGIYTYRGTTTITNSTVSGNIARDGGGIFNQDGTTTITNSTVNGNNATDGGGIYTYFGTTAITNSTVSGNTAVISGGGIYNYVGILNLTSVTVAYNSDTNSGNDGGGGIHNLDGTANLRNTIVAKITSSTSATDFFGTISSTSTFNLIGNGTGMTGITNGAGGNQVGDSTNPIDPKLNPTLASNDGTTLNHALLLGSPALDKGNDTGTDQRGFLRPVDLASIPNATGGNAADIGAFEAQTAPLAPTAATVSISGRVMTAGGGSIMNVRLSLTDSQGNIRTTTTDSSGNYRFDDVQAGETYILTVTGKRFTFSQPVQVLTINEEANQVNFIANSEKRLRVF